MTDKSIISECHTSQFDSSVLTISVAIHTLLYILRLWAEKKNSTLYFVNGLFMTVIWYVVVYTTSQNYPCFYRLALITLIAVQVAFTVSVLQKN